MKIWRSIAEQDGLYLPTSWKPSVESGIYTAEPRDFPFWIAVIIFVKEAICTISLLFFSYITLLSFKLYNIALLEFISKGSVETAEMREYAKKVDKSGADHKGCVVVDERLAEILQLLMDKYTFEGVDNSWIKLCYYYDNISK